MEWEGKVFTGDGKAADFVELQPYSAFIEDVLGFYPYPGTLNLRGDEDRLKMLKDFTEKFHEDSFQYRGQDFGGVTVYPVIIGGYEAGVLKPVRTRYGEDVAEVVSEVCLREKLDLEDADRVKISAS